MRLQSAIFDLDGTLLDTASFWEQLCLDLLKKYGADPEPGVGALVSAMTPKEGAAYCKEHYHLTASLEEILGEVSSGAADFYCHRVQAKPGVDKALSLLKMEGVWMYVATATDRHLAEAAEVFDEVEASPVMQDLWVAYQKKFSYASDLGWNTVMAAVRQLFDRCEGTA